MNLTQTILAMATGVVPLVPIVMGLTQWTKIELKTSEERIINLFSMGYGVALGLCFMLAQQYPVDFTGWFIDVLYGIILGLTASGLFKTGQQLMGGKR